MNSVAPMVLTMLVAASSGQARACDSNRPAPNTAGLDLGWISSELVVYGVDDGELYEARLNSIPRKSLVRKSSSGSRGLAISPDGHYLVYGAGTDEDTSKQVYHLFDLSRGVDRVVPVLARPDYVWELEFIGFSPDSRSVVWLDDDGYAVAGTDKTRPELLVFSTENLARRTLPYPAPATGKSASRSCFTPQWSLDGNAIYGNFMSGDRCSHLAEDEHNLVYFRIDIASGESTIVDGGYTFDHDGFFFRSFYIDGGSKIAKPYPCLGSHGCLAYGQELKAGNSRAWLHHVDDPNARIQLVDGAEELFVQVGDAPPDKIATGWSSSCAGTDIQLIDWVEGGKYLIYQQQGNTYLYAAKEKRSVPLPQLTGSFNWLPLATSDRLYYQVTDGNGEEKRYGPASAGN
jgi:hypothetical protein